MGGKSDRDRQKRLQGKRKKRATQRKAQRSGSTRGDWIPVDEDFLSPRALPFEVMVCVDVCEALLADCGPFTGENRQTLLAIAQSAGGIWARLLSELERFLYQSAPWSLTCADLEPVRGCFEARDSEEAFSRLWELALTCSPDGAELPEAEYESCAYRATRAFQELRECLDNSARRPAKAVRAVLKEMDAHGSSAQLKRAYEKLLLAAVASVHAKPAAQARAVSELIIDCEAAFAQHSSQDTHSAWWPCGRLFLTEVLARHGERGCVAELLAHPSVIAQVFDEVQAPLWMARHSASAEPLRAIHVQTRHEAWLGFLARQIDPRTLSFEDRLRFEMARLRLLRAKARSLARASEAAPMAELLAVFQQMQALLAHGVPSASRALQAALEPALFDFYIDTVSETHGEGAALQSTEALLKRYPEDFRLACLYATGAIVGGERKRFPALTSKHFQAHVDAQLFARSVWMWTDRPQGAKAAAAVRPLLFDPLDREHRKQCLIELAQQALRHATSLSGYQQQLRRVMPYFERDNFVCRDLAGSTAVESALVFFATMMAPLLGVRLSLTESQSQQWVSYAQQVARQSPFGAELVRAHLKAPSHGFVLAPGVLLKARENLSGFQAPPSAPSPTVAKVSTPPKPRRSTRHRDSGAPPEQPGLFNDLDP